MGSPIYTDEQNRIFIDNIKEYRDFIQGHSEVKTREITINFGERLIKEYPQLAERNPKGEGVAQRLVYFDNLLAGVEFPHEYYLQNTLKHFGTVPRTYENKEPNRWVVTLHSI
jgi:hypothetical protein